MTKTFEEIAFSYGKRRAEAGNPRTLPPFDLLWTGPTVFPALEETAKIDRAFQMGYDSAPLQKVKEQ
jgi:hypothetical protein